ncbi:MAG: hypothetical protein LUG65_06000, partial [Clostridiales bacterium]|nr:hypothetical protein [Clostridiales bacterium]
MINFKTKLCKVGSLALAIAMVFSLSIQAFAAEVEGEKQAVIRDEIVEIVSTASTTEERDRLLSELL